VEGVEGPHGRAEGSQVTNVACGAGTLSFAACQIANAIADASALSSSSWTAGGAEALAAEEEEEEEEEEPAAPVVPAPAAAAPAAAPPASPRTSASSSLTVRFAGPTLARRGTGFAPTPLPAAAEDEEEDDEEEEEDDVASRLDGRSAPKSSSASMYACTAARTPHGPPDFWLRVGGWEGERGDCAGAQRV
jgi:hypothetical protein